MPELPQIAKETLENILAVEMAAIRTVALCSMNGNILHVMNGDHREFFILTREERANLVSKCGIVESVAYEVV